MKQNMSPSANITAAAPAPSPSSSSPPPSPPRLRWSWDFGVDLGDSETVRLLQLLRALLDTTALRQAAAAAAMSYRAAWGLLRRCETAFGVALVKMERGRGTTLTPFGAALVEMDGAARLALNDVHAVWEQRMLALVKPALQDAAAAAPLLRMFASHDIVLADWIEHGRRPPLSITWQGGENALAALARGKCDIAGFHAPQQWSAAQLQTWLQRWLQPRLHFCLTLMQRTQGLLLARGNPLQLRSLADIAATRARMVNRQRGSGTRNLIDQLFAANGVDPRCIDGYGHEEFTHEAAAATVAGGLADVGVGIEAAAARWDLDFLPLLQENYYVAMPRTLLQGAAGQIFLARIRGATFAQRLAALPGYKAPPLQTPTSPRGRRNGFFDP